MAGGSLLILASLPPLLFGVPVSEGFAPAGLSLGPLAIIGGAILYLSERPRRDQRWTDDGATFRNLDILP
ncbi:hypothetical protein [Microbacterium tumbae]